MSVQVGAIKEFVEGIYDGPHATPKESDHGPIFLGIKNVTPEGRLDFSEIRHVSPEEYPRWTKRVTPQKDDIVFSYEATLHRYALIPDGFVGCLGRRMALVRPEKSKVYPKYLYYYFLSTLWRKETEASIISGATVDRIPLTKVPSFKVSFPRIREQEIIADILSTYDDLIENNRRRIALLEESARQLYKEWFVRFRFPGHEHVKIIDGVPEGWGIGQVNDLGNVITGKTPSTKITENYGGAIPFIKTPDMHGKPIVIVTETYLTERGANTQPKKLIPARSILVSCIGTVGVTSMNASEAHTNQQINAVIPSQEFYRYFSFFALASLKPRLEAIGGGATMANVNKGKFESLPILLPKMPLLESYHDSVLPIFDQLEKLAIIKFRLAEARDLLLPKLMTGEIAV